MGIVHYRLTRTRLTTSISYLSNFGIIIHSSSNINHKTVTSYVKQLPATRLVLPTLLYSAAVLQ